MAIYVIFNTIHAIVCSGKMNWNIIICIFIKIIEDLTDFVFYNNRV